MSAGRQAAAVSIREVTVSYTRGSNVVTPIDRLSLEIEPGSLVLLLGPSGCGKTTLLSCLAGIQRPSSGAIVVDDVDVAAMSDSRLTEYRRHGVGVVFQAFNLIPSLSALDNVALPMRAAGVSRRAARERATELLTDVGLADRLDHRPASLSGGQQQRVAIARALGLEPRLIVADEPTANLDHRQVDVVLRLLRGLTDRGHTVVVSTHDNRLLPLADRVVDLAADAEPTIVPRGEDVHLPDGTLLFRQGEHGEEVFEVLEGAVALRLDSDDGGSQVVAVMQPGDCFGEMGALFGLPRSAAAVVQGDSVLAIRTVDQFRAVHGADRLRALVGRSLSGTF